MNNEMMLFQARQDFIDLHQDLKRGRVVTLERYDLIARELKSLDDLNFEVMLRFVEKSDNIEIESMWNQISNYMENVKKAGEWRKQKEKRISWDNGQLQLLD